MFSILKLVIIILLNETYAHISQNTEIILLPASNPTGAKKIPIALKVFGRLIQLNLRRNDRIVSPAFGIWKYNANRVTEKLLELNLSNPCYYYHEDHISYAAINFCHEDGLKGHVFVENKTLEIHPLRNEFKLMCLIDDFREETNFSFGKPHLIKRSLEYFADSNSYHWDKFELNRRHVHNAQQNLTAKLAIFIDKSAYDKLIFFLHYNYIMVNEEISQYVNRIQAAFNYPNLNVFLKILVVRINILVNQPSNLAVWHGNSAVDRVLDLFCKYANSLNPTDDDNPNHWDIGLYLTGIDLYEDIQVKHKAHYRTHRDFKITGKAHIDGVCDRRFSCAVAEYRDKSEFIYSLNAVNEIGHLLGITEERDFKNLETLKAWDKDSSKKMKNLWERKTCLREQAISKKITPETIIPKTENNDNNNTRQNLTIELAVFFDEAAYHMYMPLLDNNKRELRNMILAYVNQIQAMFHHPSFGTPLDISLVRLKIMKEQPSDFPVFDGDVIQLLDSFCNYATTQNPRDDNDPHHWDISLYLTGINIYSKYNQQRYYEPITEFFRNGACVPFNSCIIVEFGFNKSIHSAFATSRAAAHAIGRLLGMDDDNGSINSTCPKGEYIMTDWLYHRGQITWSECSRNSAKKLWKTKECLLDRTRRENPADPYALDHLRYHDLPGREWTAKAQCELFLRDNDANVVTLDDICQVLQCETPHKKNISLQDPR
nr:PREDICTED: uncharacterized protein LOC105678717 [Linepithema humile]